MLKEIKSRLVCIQQDLDSIQEMLKEVPEENSEKSFEPFDPFEGYQLVGPDPETGLMHLWKE